MKKVFIAISLSVDLKDRIYRQVENIKEPFKQKDMKIRWTLKDNYHVTLKFIGKLEETQIKNLLYCCQQIASQSSQFLTEISTISAFPFVDHARVIWLGVQVREELLNLFNKLENSLDNIGIKKELRPYKPHVTIARLKCKRNLSDLIVPIENITLGKIIIDNLTVFESRTDEGFSNYVALKSFYFPSDKITWVE